MKKIITKASFAAIILLSLVVNLTQSKDVNASSASLIEANMLAIANAEDGDTYVCIQPPRTICHFLNDWTPIYGEHY